MSSEITVKLPEGISPELLEMQAARFNKDEAELCSQGLEIIGNMSPAVYRYLNDFAENLKCPLWVVIQNILISRMARAIAKLEVWGFRNELLLEFQSSDGLIVTGKGLFESLLSTYRNEEEQKRQGEIVKNQELAVRSKTPEEQETIKQEAIEAIQRRFAEHPDRPPENVIVHWGDSEDIG
jgi:hypothetical protein